MVLVGFRDSRGTDPELWKFYRNGPKNPLVFQKTIWIFFKDSKTHLLISLVFITRCKPFTQKGNKMLFFKKKFDKISKHNELFHFIRCCLQQTVPSVCHISCQTGLHLFLHYSCIEHLSVSHLHNNHIIDHFKI